MKDRGHAAVEFALATGVLMLPVVIVVVAFGPWSETRVSAKAMAAEAARAAVLSLDQAEGDVAVSVAATDQGIDLSSVRLGWCGSDPGPVDSSDGWCPMGRGDVVSVAVELWTPLIQTPWGPVGGMWVSAVHSEPVDLYRSLG